MCNCNNLKLVFLGFVYISKNKQVEDLWEFVCDFQAEMLLTDVVEAFGRNLKLPNRYPGFQNLELFSAWDCCELLLQFLL